MKKLLAIDFDGVLTGNRAQTWPLDGLDLTLVRMAMDRGYAVQIFTANDHLGYIAQALHEHGIKSHVDWHMERVVWDGGHDGRTVIISHRKMWVCAIIDDRAFTFKYGDDPSEVLRRVAETATVG